MKVAAIQLSSQDDVSANLQEVTRQVEAAAAEGATLCLLPEGFAFLGPESERARHAEVLDGSGRVLSELSELCQGASVSLICGGMAETSEDPERPYNTSVVLDHTGHVVATYRKVHLFDVSLSDGSEWRESSGTSPGARPQVATLGDITFGLSICFDLRFPEIYAAERRQGATVLTVPAAFTQVTGEAHWHLLLRARAVETQCWVLAAAQQGSHPRGRQTFGHSMIVDPWGRVVVEQTESGPGFVLGDIDLELLSEVRARMPLNHGLDQRTLDPENF